MTSTAQIGALLDEIERLRAALEQIADGLPNHRAPHRFSAAKDIARLALGG